MKKTILLVCLAFLASTNIYPQSNELQIGTSSKYVQNSGSLYDYSDPEAVNIKVSIWGFVRNPGKYIIPSYCNLNDLISYSGGPNQDANVDDLRLFRTEKDSSQTLIKFNYNDLFWNKDINIKDLPKAPELKAGDILIVPGEPRLFLKDYLGLTLSIVSTVISLSILIINIAK